MFGVAAVLDEGEQWHDIKAAKHADTEQIHQYPITTGLLQEAGNIHLAIAFQPGIGEEQIHPKYAQANGTQRYQSQFHPLAGEFFTEE